MHWLTYIGYYKEDMVRGFLDCASLLFCNMVCFNVLLVVVVVVAFFGGFCLGDIKTFNKCFVYYNMNVL